MCYNVSLFAKSAKLNFRYYIIFHDGKYHNVTHTGFIFLKPNLTLHNVHFTSTFKYNLLLVSKLTQDSNIIVLFLNTYCILPSD